MFSNFGRKVRGTRRKLALSGRRGFRVQVTKVGKAVRKEKKRTKLKNERGLVSCVQWGDKKHLHGTVKHEQYLF